MKRFFAILALCAFSFAVCANPQIQSKDFDSNKTISQAVIPAHDLSFVEAKYLALDVYAPVISKNCLSSQKTRDGFSVIEDKPPIYLGGNLLDK